MKLVGFNISVHREAQRAAKKDPPSRSYGGQGATEYALSSGWWPDEAGSGTVLSNAYQQVVWVYRASG